MNNAVGKESSYGKSFAFGIALNSIYVAVELFYGLAVDSSALVADAGHNASDVVSLILSWVAIRLAKLRPFGIFTYGLRKTTILSSSINGILIVFAAAMILREAIRKIQHPVEIPGDVIMIVAGIGILINAGTALLFMKGQKSDINIKGTFLHMAADAAVSAGVLIGGLIIKNTGAFWIDPVLSFLIVAVILWSAIGLLIDSFKLAVDAAPKDIDVNKVQSFLRHLRGVRNVHNLHIWALSTTETALTAHLVVPEGYNNKDIDSIHESLQEKFNIGHATLQIENDPKEIKKDDENQSYKI